MSLLVLFLASAKSFMKSKQEIIFNWLRNSKNNDKLLYVSLHWVRNNFDRQKLVDSSAANAVFAQNIMTHHHDGE
jgi:hypothetical protein